MKLLSFTRPEDDTNTTRMGVEQNGDIVDLKRAYSRFLRDRASGFRSESLAESILGGDVTSFLQRGSLGLDWVREVLSGEYGREESLRYPREGVNVRPPLNPVSLRDGLCSETHFRNSLEAIGEEEIPELFYERPFYYRTSHTEIAGHGDSVPWPEFGEDLDFELELACVIGKEGMDIEEEEAGEHIVGYTIFNDFSIRDYQTEDMSTMLGPSKCKNFKRGNVLGPCIVTADEFDPVGVAGEARVNGETWTETDNSDMYYSFPELVSFISRGETLYPGEVIAAGTFGFGCGLELGRFLEPGDVVELEIDGIGTLRNRIG